MKKELIKTVLLIVAGTLILLTACKQTDDPAGPGDKDLSEGQEYLFEVMYENHAWGYALKGYYVDRKGYVYGYEYSPEVSYDWDAENPDSIRYDELAFKYGHNSELLDSIDIDSLKEMYSLVEEAATGALTDGEYRMADAGILYSYAYKYDEENNIYLPVLLRQIGDIYIENKSSQANKLYDWLKGMDTEMADWFD